MAYIGREPQIGNFQVCDAISVVNNQAAYTMQVGGVNVSPETANHMLVSLNGILQAPTSSFTVSGSTITFAANLVTGDVIDFIQILGSVLDLGVPSDSTVSIAKLTATGTKDATTFLRGDNTFNAPPLGGITMADQWRITADKSSAGIITANWERADTLAAGFIGTGLSESSGIFSFPSTGIYMINANAYMASSDVVAYGGIQIQVTTDNSTYTAAAQNFSNASTGSQNFSVFVSYMFDVTNTTNDKFRLNASAAGNTTWGGGTSDNLTSVSVIRLGDT